VTQITKAELQRTRTMSVAGSCLLQLGLSIEGLARKREEVMPGKQAIQRIISRDLRGGRIGHVGKQPPATSSPGFKAETLLKEFRLEHPAGVESEVVERHLDFLDGFFQLRMRAQLFAQTLQEMTSTCKFLGRL
jgi:hypothetical protein